MAKTVVFENGDEVLIQKIEKFAEEKKISFDEAVKELCEIACNVGIWGEY